MYRIINTLTHCYTGSSVTSTTTLIETATLCRYFKREDRSVSVRCAVQVLRPLSQWEIDWQVIRHATFARIAILPFIMMSKAISCTMTFRSSIAIQSKERADLVPW